jgi:hypothetical protein
MVRGRTISADDDAYGSIRVMGTSCATGYAAGVAAATWCEDRYRTIAAVRKELERQDALV